MGMIRIILAISVVLFHATDSAFAKRPPAAPIITGNTAVGLFFTISGFYMGLVLASKYSPASGSRWWLDFYKSRFLRLYPAFLVITLLTITANVAYMIFTHHMGYPNLLLQQNSLQDRMGYGLSAAITLSNATMFAQDIPSIVAVSDNGDIAISVTRNFPEHFTLAHGALLIHPAWSIGSEIWFYLLAPWLIRRSTLVIGVVFTASLILKLYLMFGVSHHLDSNDRIFYVSRFFPSELCLFLAGSLACRYRKMAANWLRWPTLLVTLGTICTWGLWAPEWAKGFLLLGFPFALPAIFDLTSKWHWDRLIGELSYPIYISHALVITTLAFVVRKINPQALPNPWMVVGVTIILSAMIYAWIDRPVDRYRQRFARQPKIQSQSSELPVEQKTAIA